MVNRARVRHSMIPWRVTAQLMRNGHICGSPRSNSPSPPQGVPDCITPNRAQPADDSFSSRVSAINITSSLLVATELIVD
jgi:hypothetical protein